MTKKQAKIIAALGVIFFPITAVVVLLGLICGVFYMIYSELYHAITGEYL